MYAIRVDDVTYVTTPCYVGTSDQVEQAQNCEHVFKASREDVSGKPVPDFKNCVMFLERCENCCATRTKVTGLKHELDVLFQEANASQ